MLHIWIKVFSYIKAKDTNSEENLASLLPNAIFDGDEEYLSNS